MELYYTFKTVTEFIIPAIIGVIIFVGFLILCGPVIKDNIKKEKENNKKIKLLEDNGFERYLWSVSGGGDGEYYAWRKGDKHIQESEFYRYSIERLEKWINAST